MNTILMPKHIGSLYLREIEESDYMDYFEIGKDPEVCEYLNWGPFEKPLEALWVIREIFLKRPESGLPRGYAITMDGVMIGMVDFHTINSNENSIEIGCVLKKDYWGRGFMRKCISYMVKLAFSEGFDKVVLGSIVGNERSIRMIESLGFHYEYEEMTEMDINTYALGRYYAKYKNE